MAEMPPIISQQIFDPEALAAAIHNATFQPCQLSSGPSASKLTRIICPEVCLDFASLGPAMLFSGTMPKDSYTLVFVTECERKGRSFNFAVEHNDGYMGFFPPGGILDAYTPEGYANATLTVPTLIFEEAVERLFPEIPQDVLKHGAGLRIGAADQARVRRLLTMITTMVHHDAAALNDDAVRTRLEIELLDAFLTALRGSCGNSIPKCGRRVQGKMKRLRQARDYLSTHLHQPVSLADLCNELGMSRRGVEMLFQDSLDIGPNAFIRQQRLHRVRHALLENHASPGAIKQTALTWGFWHMGHFSRDYQSLFGERPSTTLIRQRMS